MKLKPITLAMSLALGFACGIPSLAVQAAPNKESKPSASAAAQKMAVVEGITEYRLSNGLRILFAPDASKPTTTVNVTYLVGSRHEGYGETGMAHLLEHLVFKGTQKRSNIMDELGKRGMAFNGTTFYDRTNYYESFPASEDNLRWALEMEADRMVNSRIAKKDLDTEFSVVRNEMEMGENNFFRNLWGQLSAVTFDWHNYGNTTIGARSDVEGVKIENLQGFYRKYYQPDNAVLMVAGKFDVSKTLALIEKNFGALAKPTRVLTPTWTREAPRNGTREVTVRRVSDDKAAAVLYPVSSGTHSDGAALQAFGDILGNAPNGRLHKRLVETKQAVNVMNISFQLAEPGYSLFLAKLGKDQDIAPVKKTLIETVEGFAKDKVTEEELKRAKTNLLNEFEKTMNDPEAFCVEMSEAIAMGDWRLFFLNRDRVEALKVEDVQRVAENYFKEDNRSFGQFLPVEKTERAQIPATPNVQDLVANYKGKTAVVAGETFDPSPANIDKRTEKLSLANGAKVALLSKKTRGETVHGAITLRLGDEKTLFGQAVAKDIATDILMRGTTSMTRAQLETKLGELKAKIMINGAGQNVSIGFETTRSHLPATLDLLREVLRSPAFPSTEFELLQKENLTQLESTRSEPNAVASRAMAKLQNAPYQAGDIRYQDDLETSIKQYKEIKLEAVKAFYQNFFGASNSEISLVGDFDAKEVKAKLATVLGDWKSPKTFKRVERLALVANPVNESFETPDKASAIFIALQTLNMTDSSPDYPALLLANQVFGGGVKSRLMERLRQKEGISYGAGSSFSAPSLDTQGSLIMYAMYAPSNLAKLKTGVSEEVARFIKDGLSQTEFDDAKKALQQERSMSLAQDPVLARMLGGHLFLSRSMATEAALDDKVSKLTLDQVNAAIKRNFKPEMFHHFYAGDFAGAAKKANVK
jgi:zinc protease